MECKTPYFSGIDKCNTLLSKANELKFSVEQQTAEIDGVQYKLTRIKPEKPKLPTWDELSGLSGAITTVGFDSKYYAKVKTFIRLLEVADYLNEGWAPNFEFSTNSDWVIQCDILHSIFPEKTRLSLRVHVSGSSVRFKTKELAETAIEIFRANGCEQDLIDFYTK